MLLCGQEEPIRPNGQIYQLDEILGRRVLADVENTKLNRYSFVWLGKWAEHKRVFSRLIMAILEAVRVEAIWAAAYHTIGDYSVRAKLYARKRAIEGWNIYQDESLTVATLPVTDIDMDNFKPQNEKQYSGLQAEELLLFLGPAPTPEALAQKPARRSIEWSVQYGGIYGQLSPSWRFLEWLADNQYTVAYTERTTGSHWVLVVVGTLRIPTVELAEQGIVQEIWTGEDADRVRRHPPS